MIHMYWVEVFAIDNESTHVNANSPEGALDIARAEFPDWAWQDGTVMVSRIDDHGHEGIVPTTMLWPPTEPIGAIMPDGTRLDQWDERLRAAGGTPIYPTK